MSVRYTSRAPRKSLVLGIDGHWYGVIFGLFTQVQWRSRYDDWSSVYKVMLPCKTMAAQVH